MKRKFQLLFTVLVGLNACGSGGNGGSIPVEAYPHNPTNTLPSGYQCLPSNLPTSNAAIDGKLQIAYGSNCQVADVTDSSIQSSLESMSIALTSSSGLRYCTGTPISYDATTKVGYVLTAAHCVVGNSKSPGQSVTASNIVTFSNNKNYVNQSLNASSFSGVTGAIQAVYIPSQYCQANAFEFVNGSYQCSNLSEQNGDLALVKVNFANKPPLNINQQVQLATSSTQLASPSYIMALGYGITNTTPNNTNLFYITYENFATNSYKGENGLSTIMNGYSLYGTEAYSNIICGGDSGGGDFYWSNNAWNLIGVHSYGSPTCGQSSSSYAYSSLANPGASDISADVRPFTMQLQNIMNNDMVAGGCNNNVAADNAFVCADH